MKGSSRPKLFVLGDSISVQFGPYLEAYIDGKFEYARKAEKNGEPSNGGTSTTVREFLEAWAANALGTPADTNHACRRGYP